MNTFEEAREQGYRISKAVRPSKKLRTLCAKLGPAYHLAAIDGGNVIHRVIGAGWDVAVFPSRPGAGKYSVVIWKDYGRQRVAMETEVVAGAVKSTVEMLLHIFVPDDVYPTRYNLGPRAVSTSVVPE